MSEDDKRGLIGLPGCQGPRGKEGERGRRGKQGPAGNISNLKVDASGPFSSGSATVGLSELIHFTSNTLAINVTQGSANVNIENLNSSLDIRVVDQGDYSANPVIVAPTEPLLTTVTFVHGTLVGLDVNEPVLKPGHSGNFTASFDILTNEMTIIYNPGTFSTSFDYQPTVTVSSITRTGSVTPISVKTQNTNNLQSIIVLDPTAYGLTFWIVGAR